MSESLDAGVLVDTLATPSGGWTRVDVCGVVGSTNALSLAEPVPWRVVVAEQQDAGRGRHARAWVSPAGASVAMSMTVPLPPRPDEWGWIPLITGSAVCAALERVAGGELEVALKWPNDVLVRARRAEGEPRKVCGILCESGGDSVVVGVGINVRLAAEDLPVPTATSLLLEGVEARDLREQVVIGVAQEFMEVYGTFSSGGPFLERIRRGYRQRCSTIGRPVRMHLPGEQIVEGCAVDVDDEGRLVIETGGARRAFAAGDVVHVRPTQRA